MLCFLVLLLALLALGPTNTLAAVVRRQRYVLRYMTENSSSSLTHNSFEPHAVPRGLVPLDKNPGIFRVVGNGPVPAMHVAPAGGYNVLFLDKVETITLAWLPNGRSAYSALYNTLNDTFVPLAVTTNAFCSGGCLLSNGTVLSVGGNGPLPDVDPTVGDGFTGLRFYTPGTSTRAWAEPGYKLTTPRWYPSVILLSTSNVLVCSGSKNGLDPSVPANNNPTCKLLDPYGNSLRGSVPVDVLIRTQPYHMYPFMYELPESGSIFMFAGKSSQIIDPNTYQARRVLPEMPGMFRTYPNGGSSVMLMLSPKWNNCTATILICGGGAYQDITSPTDPSCGLITPSELNPSWTMEAMPDPRSMLDMIVLAEGTVVILNGAAQGAEGFGLASDPVTYVLYYSITRARGFRFTKGETSTIPRLYHSVAMQLIDGRIMVAGSNPNEQPVFYPDATHPFPTEMRIEYFYPYYITGDYAYRRPTNVRSSSSMICACGDRFSVSFDAKPGGKGVMVTLTAPGYVTHGVHMGQRVVELETEGFKPGETTQRITAIAPATSKIAPPGVYWLCVLVDGALNDVCIEITVLPQSKPR